MGLKEIVFTVFLVANAHAQSFLLAFPTAPPAFIRPETIPCDVLYPVCNDRLIQEEEFYLAEPATTLVLNLGMNTSEASIDYYYRLGSEDRVCIPSKDTALCQNIGVTGSQAVCVSATSKIDCAMKLVRGQAEIGVFSEEEMLLLAQRFPFVNRVVASIKDRSRSARTDVCSNMNTNGKTVEELEVEVLSQFFGSACRPGPWSANASIDADLRNRFPSLCSLCGSNSNCLGYNINMGATVPGVQNDNRHIQALECLRSSNTRGVAFVAWQHVQEFFRLRNPQEATSYAALCEDGSTRVLTSQVLSSQTAPCSLVKQPWGGIVVNAGKSIEIQNALRQWWPNGANPGGNSWQSILFDGIVGGTNAMVVFEEVRSPSDYIDGTRNIPTIEASSSCLPQLRWCTASTGEYNKCMWIRSAAHSLGIEPAISCLGRNNIIGCFADVKNNIYDFFAADSNFGYVTRQHFGLSPVKFVQSSYPNAFTRVVALVKESTVSNGITRFENLRNRKACFPQFSGVSYISFLKTAQELGIISASECDYGKALAQFFDSTCAPGAVHNSQILGSYNTTNLCTLCRTFRTDTFTCRYDISNMYYGNTGSVRCLADPQSDVAFVELQNIEGNLLAAGLQENQVRALCKNNTLALSTGVNIDQNCLLAFVADSEVLTRPNNPLQNTISTYLDTLDLYFGSNVANWAQFINFEMYSTFDGISNLLFKDTAVGFLEPSADSTSEGVRNHFELYKHLESCTSATA